MAKKNAEKEPKPVKEKKTKEKKPKAKKAAAEKPSKKKKGKGKGNFFLHTFFPPYFRLAMLFRAGRAKSPPGFCLNKLQAVSQPATLL